MLQNICDECTAEVDLTGWSLPPFKWSQTVSEIEANTAVVIEAATANLDAVSAAAGPTFVSVISPLMSPPHYKTKHNERESTLLTAPHILPEYCV